jgi:hypothetical protein
MSKFMTQDIGEERGRILLTPLFCYFQENLRYIFGHLNKVWIVKSLWALSRFRMHDRLQMEEV